MQLIVSELKTPFEDLRVFENLKDKLIEVQKVLDKLLPLKAEYNKMCLPAQIELDLFLAFTLNALQWINLRIQGIDLSRHPIKDEIMRIRTTMIKWQEYKSRDKRPRVNVEAAKRFIKSGLYDRYRNKDIDGEPPKKKKHLNKED